MNHTTERPGTGDRLAGASLALLLVGGAAALAASVAWSVWMKTSPTLDAEERVRGWTALLRDLPTVVLAWAVPIGALALAARACRQGAGTLGRVACWLSVAVLFVVSVSTIGGTVVDSALDAGPNVKWMLLPISIVVAAVAAVVAQRATHPSRQAH